MYEMHDPRAFGSTKHDGEPAGFCGYGGPEGHTLHTL